MIVQEYFLLYKKKVHSHKVVQNPSCKETARVFNAIYPELIYWDDRKNQKREKVLLLAFTKRCKEVTPETETLIHGYVLDAAVDT